jgi:hypothetical protein
MPEQKSAWSLEDVVQAIGEIAHDEDSKERLKALSLLSKLNSGAPSVPPPLNEAETVERLARLMRAAGENITKKAFISLWPKRHPAVTVYNAGEVDPEVEEAAAKVITLKLLRKHVPAMAHVRGLIRGYPAGSSAAEKAEWCQNQARKMLYERKRADSALARVAVEAEEAAVEESPEVPGTV